MKILMIGATGGVGHRLVPLLVKNGHTVVGLHRRPEQVADLEALGATPVSGDIMDLSEDDFVSVAKGCDAVVFSAGASGSGRERTTAIDGDAPIKLVAAAEKLGISKFYLVSVFPEAGRSRELGEQFEHYMTEKKRADVAVASSGLDWVVLRPGTLVDDDGDGMVKLGRAVPYGNVARGNVARVLAQLIEHPEICREFLELTDGDTDIDAAVANFK